MKRGLCVTSIGGCILALASTAGAEVVFIHASDSHYGATATPNSDKTARVLTMNTLPGKNFPASMGGGTIQNIRGVTVGGDLIDGGTTATETTQLNDWKADFGLKGGDGKLNYPVYEAWGNHDEGSVVPAAITARNANRVGLTARSTQDGGQGMHYSWDWGPLHLVNANLFVGDANKGTHTSSSYDPRNSLSWLISDLATNVGNSGRPVVIMHHMIVNTDSNEWWTEQQRIDYFNAVKNYNVIAVLEGHESGGHYLWTQDGGQHNIDVFSGNDMMQGYWVFRLTDDHLYAGRTTNGGSTFFSVFDKEVSVPAPVPEPASLGLLAIGAISLLRRRSRRDA